MLIKHFVHSFSFFWLVDIELRLECCIQLVLLIKSGLTKQVVAALRKWVFKNFLCIFDFNKLFGGVRFKIFVWVVNATSISISIPELCRRKRGVEIQKNVEVVWLL